MYPARTSSLWLATSASAGASRSVGIKSCDQRCMVVVSNRRRIFIRIFLKRMIDCKRLGLQTPGRAAPDIGLAGDLFVFTQQVISGRRGLYPPQFRAKILMNNDLPPRYS